MKLEIGLLRSSVARRVFTLFIIAALIPIAASSMLSFKQVTQLFTEQAHRHLRSESKAYGMDIIGRLMLAKGLLIQIADDVSSNGNRMPYKRGALTPFSAIYSIDDANQVKQLFSNSKKIPDDIDFNSVGILPEGETYLFIHRSPPNAPIVFLSQQLTLKNHRKISLIAELNSRYLWRERDSFSQAVNYCVLDENNKILYCSAATPDKTFFTTLEANESRTPPGVLAWVNNNRRYMAGHWKVFLDGAFHSKSWAVVASQPSEQALAAINTFRNTYPQIIILSIVTVLFLSIMQVRRIMIPLEILISGTRKLANKQFFEKISIGSGDEFEELGAALNTMGDRLGRQFNALTTLAEVDELILSTLNMEPVLKVVLGRMHEIVPCDFVGVMAMDNDANNRARICVNDPISGEHIVIDRALLPEVEIQELLSSSSNLAIQTDQEARSYLNPIKRLGATKVLVFPILNKDSVLGCIKLGYRQSPQIANEDLAQVRDFADRVAVAFSSAEREEKLYYQAHYDSLTGLPNRQAFKERLTHELAHAQRENYKVGVLFIDLDRFKYINDTQGHSAGDQLLKEAAARLKQCVREMDAVARLGGDEFILTLTELSDTRVANTTATKVIDRISEPFSIDNRQHYLGASIGIAIFPDDGDTPEKLLMNADAAMYQAKAQGRGGRVFFQKEMNRKAQERVCLEMDLACALDRDEFFLHFQPQVETMSGKIIGAEALIRWQHPERGLVSPGIFMPIVEDSALVITIGNWVLREACEQYMRWLSMGVAPTQIAVNVSMRQFRDGGFVRSVGQLLNELGMPARCLELEITERLLAEDIEEIILTLDKLSELGIRLAIDDFGTGYSSLSYLSRFPIDVLKIDKSFIDNTAFDKDALAIVNTIIAMAQTLGMETVAEGVETGEQLNILRDLGCEYVQGFYFSRPISADDFAGFIRCANSNIVNEDALCV